MKQLFFVTLLLATASCGSSQKDPKFNNPVLVVADNVPVYEALDSTSRVLVKVDKGDTLEFDGTSPAELGRLVCRVMPDARLSRFPHSEKAGYIERRFLSIPDSTLNKDKAGTLRVFPPIPSSAPEHLHKR